MEIVFTASKGWFGKAIRYFTKRSWIGSARVSHSLLRYGGRDSKWLVEASIHGFAPSWWPLLLRKNTIFKRFEIVGINEAVFEDTIDEMIEEMIGKRYDYLAVIGFAISVIGYWITGRKIKNFLGRSTAFSCSEAMYRIFLRYKEKTGTVIFGDYDPETVFPEELLKECEIKSQYFREITEK